MHLNMFPRVSQIIPISSFIIMRINHFVVWFDERSKSHKKKLKEIKKKKRVNVNIYLKRSFQETIELIRKKSMNVMTVILSVDEIETAENLINDANEINELAVFMIYSKNKQFCKLSEAKENVIYADCSYN